MSSFSFDAFKFITARVFILFAAGLPFALAAVCSILDDYMAITLMTK